MTILLVIWNSEDVWERRNYWNTLYFDDLYFRSIAVEINETQTLFFTLVGLKILLLLAIYFKRNYKTIRREQLIIKFNLRELVSIYLRTKSVLHVFSKVFKNLKKYSLTLQQIQFAIWTNIRLLLEIVRYRWKNFIREKTYIHWLSGRDSIAYESWLTLTK